MNIDGFSMRPLTLELARELIGGRVDKITQQSRASMVIYIRQPGRSLMLHLSLNPQNPSAHLIKNPPENLPEPPTFCMVLRKNLENGRIADIRQHELDRVILIDVDTIGVSGRIETLTLVIELVGKYSNIILIRDGLIVDALKKIGTNSSRVRTVLPNQPYELPPSQHKLDVFQSSNEEITARILSDETLRLDKALMNTCQGFGPQTTREVIFNAGLSTMMRISEMAEQDIAALIESINVDVTLFKYMTPKPTLIIDSSGKVIAMSIFPLRSVGGEMRSFETISEMLEAADELIGSYVPPDKDVFSKLVRNELRRAVNKIDVLTKELAASDNAGDWKILADNLLTYQYQFTDHADDEISVANIYSESGDLIKIPMDRKLTIAANIQAFYKKYDKLKRAAQYITEQIDKCKAEISYLETIEHALTTATTLADVDEVRAELLNGGYIKETSKRSASSKKSQPMQFTAPDGSEIFVGKNNLQNDRLRQSAAPDDLWLHTKDIPGSHVILKTNGVAPSDETILYAAKIAARFSKAADSSNVPVDYVACRYVKKPSGSKPGFVVFTNQKTVYVTPEKIFLID